MSTFLAAAVLDFAPGAPADAALVELEKRLDGREPVHVATAGAPGSRQRLLLLGDHCQAWLPGVVRELLVARPEIERAIVAADWDEFSTEHLVLRGGGAGTIVHGVEVVDLAGLPDEARPPAAAPLACGLARVPVGRAEFHPSDGPDARVAAAALFGVPAERMDDADRELERNRDLMLCRVASTYGMWWDALEVPFPDGG